MKKMVCLLVALLAINLAHSQFVVEKIWESTAGIPAAGDGKQGVGHDGVIYIQDKSTSTIFSYKQENGSIVKTAYASSDVGSGFVCDEAGNLAVRTGYFAAAAPNGLKLYKKGETTPTSISFSFPNSGRADFNTASGNFFSEEGGYVFFYNNTQSSINYVKIKNGGATAEDVTVGSVGSGLVTGNSLSVVYKGDENTFISQVRSNAWQKFDGTTTTTLSLDGLKNTTLGACMFVIKDSNGNDKELWAYNTGATNYNSEFKVRNMTDESDLESSVDATAKSFMIGDGTATSTAYANWLTCSKIDDKTFYIHQVLPGVGIALYKVYDKPAPIIHLPDVIESKVEFGEVLLGKSAQQIFKVSAENLIEDLVISSNNEAFAVNVASLTPESGAIAETEVTITYTPATAAEESAILTLSSKGISKEIALIGKGVEPPTTPFVVEKLWESTADMPVQAEARQGGGYDGTFYVLDKASKNVLAYKHNGTTVEKSTYFTSPEATGVGNTIDDAGNMVLTVGWAGSNPAKAVIIKAGGKESKVIDFTLPPLGLAAGFVGRTDFISAFGDLYSPEGGLIFYYSNGQTQVNYVKVTNGGATESDVIVGSITGSNITAGIAAVNVIKGTENSFIAHVRSANWQSCTTGGEAVVVTPPDAKISTLGGCIFTLKDSKGIEREVWVYNAPGANYDSRFKLHDMSTGVDLASKDNKEESVFMIGDGKATATTAVSNWLTASKINDGTYYVHQYHPGNGIALYKVYDPSYVPPTPPSIQLSGITDGVADFGDVTINQSKEFTFTLSGDNLTSNIIIASDNSAFEVSPTEIIPVDGKVENASITITFKPTTLESANAVLSITSKDIKEEVTLSGIGVKAQLSGAKALDATDVTTNSFKANWEAVAGANSYELVVWKELAAIKDNFSDAEAGNSSSSTGSSTTWKGNDNFTTLTNIYSAGGAIKLGTSSKTGVVTTKEIDLSGNNGTFTVSFDVKGWTNVEGDIKVTCGEEVQTVTYAAKMTDEFESKSVTFTNGTATSTITLETTAKRAYIDNLMIGFKQAISAETIITAETSYVVTNLDAATEYQYAVIAKSSDADDTEMSNVITVTTHEVPSLVVNTLIDKIDKKDGLISLREAVKYAMEDCEVGKLKDSEGKYTITFDPAVFTSEHSTILLDARLGEITIEADKFNETQGTLAIKGFENGISVILDGADATEDEQPGTRILLIEASNHVFITNITFQNARTSGAGAAIHNSGILYLANATISNNSSLHGAIANNKELYVINTTFANNKASEGTASVVYTTGNSTIINCMIINNGDQKAPNSGCIEVGIGNTTFINKLPDTATAESIFETIDVEGNPVAGVDGTYAIKEGGAAAGIGCRVWHSKDYAAIAISKSATADKLYIKGSEGADMLIDKDQLGIAIVGPASIGSRFALAHHTITATVSNEEHGTISPSGEVKVRHGEDQVFTVTPKENYQITSVKVNGVESMDKLDNGTYTFGNVADDHAIDVTFAAIEYTITASVNNEEYGTITPSGEVKVAQGESQAFTIAALSGYALESLLVDGVEAKDDLVEGVYTFTNVDTDHTIEASFSVETGLGNSELDAFTVYYNAQSSSAILSQEALQVDVLDLSGQMLGSHQATSQVSLADIPDGVYILKITLQEGTVTRKLMKR